MTALNKILLMTSSEHEFERLKSIIYAVASSDCSIDWVSDIVAGKEMISHDNHDLCLVDCEIGVDIALSLVRKAKKQEFMRLSSCCMITMTMRQLLRE